MTGWQILLTATVVLIVYQIVAVRLSKSVQPLRRTAAHIGEQLLADARVPDDIKASVRVLLDRALSNRAAWIVVYVLVQNAFARHFLRRGNKQRAFHVPGDLRGTFHIFVRNTMIGMVATSPVTFVLTGIVVFVRMIFAPVDRTVRDAESAVTRMDRLLDRAA